MDFDNGGLMSQWILQLNPNYFTEKSEPISFYQESENDWWGISRYFKQIEIGEEAYIWQSIDYRFHPHKPRGIYAKAIIVSGPPHSQHHQMIINELKRQDVGKWRNPDVERHQKSKHSLLIRYIDCYSTNPLNIDDLMIAGLVNIGPLRFYHSEIYKLAEPDSLRIEYLLEDKTGH